MSWSANEVHGLAVKAARGGGAPPGHATAFAEAVLSHLSANRDPGVLIQALRDLPSGPILQAPVVLQRIIEQANGQDCEVPFHAATKLMLSYAEAHPNIEAIDAAGDTCRVTFSRPQRYVPDARFEVPADLAETLQERAALTYVPETDSSRQKGAGAGLSDND